MFLAVRFALWIPTPKRICGPVLMQHHRDAISVFSDASVTWTSHGDHRAVLRNRACRHIITDDVIIILRRAASSSGSNSKKLPCRLPVTFQMSVTPQDQVIGPYSRNQTSI